MVETKQADSESIDPLTSSLNMYREQQARQHQEAIADALTLHPDFPRLSDFQRDFLPYHPTDKQEAIAYAFATRLGLSSAESWRIVRLLTEQGFMLNQLKALIIEMEGEICCMDKANTIIRLYIQQEKNHRRGAPHMPTVEYDVLAGSSYAYPLDGTMDAWLAYVDGVFALNSGDQQGFLQARARVVSLYRKKRHQPVRLI